MVKILYDQLQRSKEDIKLLKEDVKRMKETNLSLINEINRSGILIN